MSDDSFRAPLANSQAARAQFTRAWEWAKAMTMAGHKLSLTITKETRSTEQNRILWSILTDLAEQCEWAVDGEMAKLTKEEVKDILTAGLKRHQRMARGIDGGLVVLGMRTSKMSVATMSELITLGHAYGDSKGVRWSRTSLGRDVPDEAFGDK